MLQSIWAAPALIRACMSSSYLYHALQHLHHLQHPLHQVGYKRVVSAAGRRIHLRARLPTPCHLVLFALSCATNPLAMTGNSSTTRLGPQQSYVQQDSCNRNNNAQHAVQRLLQRARAARCSHGVVYALAGAQQDHPEQGPRSPRRTLGPGRLRGVVKGRTPAGWRARLCCAAHGHVVRAAHARQQQQQHQGRRMAQLRRP